MGAVTEKIIEQTIENRRKFEDFCLSLTAEELDRPVPESTWMVRDFAAHLATLDPVMAQLFEATTRNEKLIGPDGEKFDIDAHNEPLVVARRSLTMAQVFEESRPKRAALIETLRAVTDEQAQNQMWFEADAKRAAGFLPLGLFMAGWAWHDPIHVADMLRGLPERAESPDVKAWLDNPFVKGYQGAMNKPA